MDYTTHTQNNTVGVSFRGTKYTVVYSNMHGVVEVGKCIKLRIGVDDYNTEFIEGTTKERANIAWISGNWHLSDTVISPPVPKVGRFDIIMAIAVSLARHCSPSCEVFLEDCCVLSTSDEKRGILLTVLKMLSGKQQTAYSKYGFYSPTMQQDCIDSLSAQMAKTTLGELPTKFVEESLAKGYTMASNLKDVIVAEFAVFLAADGPDVNFFDHVYHIYEHFVADIDGGVVTMDDAIWAKFAEENGIAVCRS